MKADGQKSASSCCNDQIAATCDQSLSMFFLLKKMLALGPPGNHKISYLASSSNAI